MMKPNKRSRLIELHENELSHILSRLPTKEAVRTSILSKNWRYKWASSYTVDIVARNLNTDPDTALFVNYMNMILASLQHIRIFRLDCDLDDLNLLQDWINNALKHRLESLDLVLKQVEGFILPCSLLNSTCLRKLNLGFVKSTLNVAANNFAPNLTSLDIYGIDIVNNNTTSTTLKFSFPLLKTFSATRYKWSNVTSVEIDAPSITTFLSWPCFSDCNYSFVILSPRITKFSYAIRKFEEMVVNGSSIVSACLLVENRPDQSELANIGLRVRKIVNELTNLQTLSLNGSLTEFLWDFLPALSYLSIQVLPFAYPLPLNKLRTLNLFCHTNAELVLELLHKTPSLEVLSFQMNRWVDFDYGSIESIPSCVVSHLEEVNILYFKCETPQYNLVKFLLKNGERLKKLIMVSVPINKQNEVEEYVSALFVSDCVLVFQPQLVNN